MKHNAPFHAIFLSLVILITLSGCASFGSRNVTRDRFNYNEAIAQSHSQQMLLNIVRLRYLEMPNFLEVSSVITSYTYDGSIGVSGTSNATPSNEIISGNANLGYTEKPTITYAPLAGQEFAFRLLKNIPVEGIFSLGHAGFSIELLMEIGIHRINNAKNMGFAAIPPPGEVDRDRQFEKESQNLTRFRRVLHLFLMLSEQGILEARRINNGDDEYTQLYFSTNILPETLSLVNELKTILDLDPNLNVFRVTTRATGRDEDEITIQSRSLLAMMSFCARGVVVPDEDEKDEKVLVLPESVKNNIMANAPLKIYSQKDIPVDPFIAVKFRDQWFYINRSDLRSKRTFATLMVLYQLQAPSQGTQAPLLTLPAG